MTITCSPSLSFKNRSGLMNLKIAVGLVTKKVFTGSGSNIRRSLGC
jgi:hypothetical protein